MSDLPFVSVIVVNHNGLRFLPACLSSLESLSYPKSRYEVLLVDNASEDKSVDFVSGRFPWVRIIESDTNLGFAGGNNLGIANAGGEYLALINNDAAADETWLKELVEACRENREIGAATSKILFFHPFLSIEITSSTSNPKKSNTGLDGRDLGIKVGSVSIDEADVTGQTQFVEGFYLAESSGNGDYRWTAGRAEARIPIPQTGRKLLLRLQLAGDNKKECRISVAGAGEAARFEVDNEFKDYCVRIPGDPAAPAYDVINSAGSIIFSDGSGADRGFLEEDRGQFEKKEEVFGACAASVILKREMLQDVGLFDDGFFMYYEDTDLAWRARFRGWKFIYAPKSVVRHVHCGSSIEWSPFFTRHVERNRLYMLAKNADSKLFLRSWLRFYLRLCRDGMRLLKAGVAGNRDRTGSDHFKLRLSVGRDLAKSLPSLLEKRRHIRRRRKLPSGDVEKWMIKR